MTLFSKINLKQFETLNYIVNNTDIAHITCIIKCIIQSDKLETPYYMDTEISLSHCVEMRKRGLFMQWMYLNIIECIILMRKHILNYKKV